MSSDGARGGGNVHSLLSYGVDGRLRRAQRFGQKVQQRAEHAGEDAQYRRLFRDRRALHVGGVLFLGRKIGLTVVLYGAVFAVNFVICNYALYTAMEYGSLSKTNLVNALSLVIPTSAGIIFWQEKYNPWLFFSALALMTVSLLLIVLNKGEARAAHGGKWLLFNSIAFLTNGLSSVIQKSEQTAMGGAGVFSMTALSFSFVAIFALAVYIPAACAKRSFGSDFLSLKNNKRVYFSTRPAWASSICPSLIFPQG